VLFFGPDGNLYVGTEPDGSVLRYDGTTGDSMDVVVPPGSGGLNYATGMSFGPDGNLYVNSLQTANVLRYDATTGVFIDEFVPSGSGGLSRPTDRIFTRPYLDGGSGRQSQTTSSEKSCRTECRLAHLGTG
jgi:outer membrane protein assembly factor BamB